MLPSLPLGLLPRAGRGRPRMPALHHDCEREQSTSLNECDMKASCPLVLKSCPPCNNTSPTCALQDNDGHAMCGGVGQTIGGSCCMSGGIAKPEQ
eukprot:12578240-Alexandrium_andersonii.AAC.1